MLALYSVEITRFSSLKLLVLMQALLCTLLKLQGSQASNCFEALTEPCHVGAWCIFYKTIYRLQAFFAIGNDTIVCIHHCINV